MEEIYPLLQETDKIKHFGVSGLLVIIIWANANKWYSVDKTKTLLEKRLLSWLYALMLPLMLGMVKELTDVVIDPRDIAANIYGILIAACLVFPIDSAIYHYSKWYYSTTLGDPNEPSRQKPEDTERPST